MSPARFRPVLLVALVALTVAAGVMGKLAIFSALALLLGGVALRPSKDTPLLWAAIGTLAVINLVIMVRFTLHNAAPGVVAGGQRALARLAVSHLREIVFAEDIARERGLVDPDGDGVGSALTLGEMTSGTLRNGTQNAPLLLRFRPLGGDLFERDGYVFRLYVPGAAGFVTEADQGVDDERAERRFVAYAWPLSAGAGAKAAAIDEHERVVWSDNDAPGQGYRGLDATPAAGAALARPDATTFVTPAQPGQDGGTWKPWRNKRGRRDLIGDRPRAP